MTEDLANESRGPSRLVTTGDSSVLTESMTELPCKHIIPQYGPYGMSS